MQQEIELAKKLKRLRTERGISIREAAAAMGIGASTLSNWESVNQTTHNPKLKELRTLSEFYQVNPGWLVGWSTMRDYDPFGEHSTEPDFIEVILAEWKLDSGTRVTITPPNTVAYHKDWLAAEGLQLKQLAETAAPDNSMAPEIHEGDDLLIDMQIKTIEKPDIYALWAGARIYIRHAAPAPTGYQIRTLNPDDKETVSAADFAEHYDVIGRIHRVGHTRR